MAVHFGDLDEDEADLLSELVGHEGIFEDAALIELLRVVENRVAGYARMSTRLRLLHQRDDDQCRECHQVFPCQTIRKMTLD